MNEAQLVLRAEDVWKSFRSGPVWRRRKIEVLRGATLQIERGSLVGLSGENGSGKSTLMKILVGMLAADRGEVETAGRIGYCPQQLMLWDKLTVEEHFSLFGSAYGMDEASIVMSSQALMDELNFTRFHSTRVEELSGGTQQKLNLAIAMLHSPEILLLDEPYSGFDWETYVRFWEMSAARRASGMGILVISHLLAERQRFDRIYDLADGRCVIA